MSELRIRYPAAQEASAERPIAAEAAAGRSMSGRPTALDEYPRASAMSEALLIAGYGGLTPSADPVVSPGSCNGDLQPDQPSAEVAHEPVVPIED